MGWWAPLFLLLLLLLLGPPWSFLPILFCEGAPSLLAFPSRSLWSFGEMRRGGPRSRTQGWGPLASWRIPATPVVRTPQAAASSLFVTRPPPSLQQQHQQHQQHHAQCTCSRCSRRLLSRGPRRGLLGSLRAESTTAFDPPGIRAPEGRSTASCTLRGPVLVPRGHSVYGFPWAAGGRRDFVAAAASSDHPGGPSEANRPTLSDLPQVSLGDLLCPVATPGGCSGSPSASAAGGRGDSSTPPPQGAPVEAPRRFVVVDGSCVMFRCYHAMPALKNREGDNVGAVMGFFRSLVQVISINKMLLR